MKLYADFGTLDLLPLGGGFIEPTSWIKDTTLAHMHPCAEVLLITDPVLCNTIVDGKIYRARGPLAMIFAPFSLHHTYYTEDTGNTEKKKKWLAFYVTKEFSQQFGEDLLPIRAILEDQKACFINISPQLNRIRPLAEDIIGDLQRRKCNFQIGQTVRSDRIQKCLFGAIVGMISMCPKCDISIPASEEKIYILDVIAYLIQNIGEPLKVENVAEHFFVSRGKLNRDFQKYVQMSVQDFLIELRLNQAKGLLLEKKLSIGEIAKQCGFENEIYFYSFFKKRTGYTPKKYCVSTRN